MSKEYAIRVQLINAETKHVFRSFTATKESWLDTQSLYDRLQKIMGGVPDK